MVKTIFKAKITLYRSAALAEDHGMSEASHSFKMDLSDGPWVQFTYEGIREQDGGFMDLYFENGCWWRNNAPWSDMTIEIIPDGEWL